MNRILVSICVLAGLFGVALAAPPDRIHYQGVLRNNLDQPLDGSFDMTFRFFDAATGGNEILIDSHAAPATPVTVNAGLLGVVLGGGVVSDGSGPGIYTSLTNVFRDHGDLYLEVQVGTEVLSPRIRILAAPFALTSATASTLASGTHANAYTFSNPVNSFVGGFSGNGSGLTGVTASTLAAGTQPNAYTFTNAANSFSGDGSGLTNVAASTLSAGTYANAYTFSNAANSFNGDGSGLTNIAASTLAAGAHSNAYTFSNPANSFSGDGSGLTSLDADKLDSIDSGSFLRSDLSDSYGVGTLTFSAGSTLNVEGSIHLNGELRMDPSGPEASQTIYFYDGGSPTGRRFEWNEGGDRFVLTGGLGVLGPIQAGISAPAGVAYNRFGSGGGAPDSSGIAAVDDVYVESDLEVDGVLAASGQIQVADSGPDANQGLLFFDDGAVGNEFVAWDDGDDRFEISDHVAVSESLRVGSEAAAATPYSHFGAAGAPTAAEVASSSDVYIAQELEVDGLLLLNGGMAVDDDGPEHDQALYFYEDGSRLGESIEWKDGADRFEVSDELHVGGDISGTGAKSFVQNHPRRPDLSLVYAALEGDEVATYTRGSAKLERGEARVALGETFAWVTNPDLGLTAYATPREHPVPLAIVSLNTTELVVRGPADAPADLVFDYVVLGLRIGFEEFPTVRGRAGDAPLPARESHLAAYAAHPELRAYSALERHTRMREATGSRGPVDISGSMTLRKEVGESGGTLSAAPGPPTPAPAEREREQPVPPAADPSEDVYARSFRPRATDLATMIGVSEPAEAGDVLTLDPDQPGRLRLARTAADAGVVGVLAEAPGVVLGSSRAPTGADEEAAETTAPVAFSGIVLCKVDGRYGAIRPGDLLTSSPTPGHAMRADDPLPGTILGKALEPLDGGTGRIRILVTLR